MKQESPVALRGRNPIKKEERKEIKESAPGGARTHLPFLIERVIRDDLGHGRCRLDQVTRQNIQDVASRFPGTSDPQLLTSFRQYVGTLVGTYPAPDELVLGWGQVAGRYLPPREKGNTFKSTAQLVEPRRRG